MSHTLFRKTKSLLVLINNHISTYILIYSFYNPQHRGCDVSKAIKKCFKREFKKTHNCNEHAVNFTNLLFDAVNDQYCRDVSVFYLFIYRFYFDLPFNYSQITFLSEAKGCPCDTRASKCLVGL